MKIIVGLGNIGREYSNTRHNLGFNIVDMLSISLGSTPDKFTAHGRASALIQDLRSTQGVMLVKPTTMMNLAKTFGGCAWESKTRCYRPRPPRNSY
jgi:PTH1 family peptidyl-tRNA hydrolase